jgi:hypothetical protein
MLECSLIQAKIDICERMKACLVQSSWLVLGQGGLREVIAALNHRILSACPSALHGGEEDRPEATQAALKILYYGVCWLAEIVFAPTQISL